MYSCPSQMHGRNIKNNKKLLWLKIVVLVAKIIICKFEQVLFHSLDESVSIHWTGMER